ncbi:MAG TPA: hypothetical protein VMX16_14675 [Terriglobia bacterium]|nr:hypothetical protein [Terriglobia bacterium]
MLFRTGRTWIPTFAGMTVSLGMAANLRRNDGDVGATLVVARGRARGMAASRSITLFSGGHQARFYLWKTAGRSALYFSRHLQLIDS